MSRIKGARSLVVALLLLTTTAFWLFDPNPFSSEITVYSIYRGKGAGNQNTCINLLPITCHMFAQISRPSCLPLKAGNKCADPWLYRRAYIPASDPQIAP